MFEEAANDMWLNLPDDEERRKLYESLAVRARAMSVALYFIDGVYNGDFSEGSEVAAIKTALGVE